ncbi:hypothetical protein BaRGS_00000139, partial [Batillaria attramentaria]
MAALTLGHSRQVVPELVTPESEQALNNWPSDHLSCPDSGLCVLADRWCRYQHVI